MACLIVLASARVGSGQIPSGKRQAAAARRPARPFSLFGAAGAEWLELTGNRVDCYLVEFGQQCSGFGGEGAFWPAGTSDNYVFTGGLQVAAIVPANAGFSWAGDTVGVLFASANGYLGGQPVSGLYNSLNANDLASWPAAAYATDTSLFNPMLIGRPAISDQDTWARYWDGGSAAGRPHAMGLVVDQRSLSWRRPLHQDIVYFIFRLINITSRLPRSYAGLAAAGYTAADQQQLAALGAQFQDSVKAHNAVLQMPDSGYTFHDLYVG